MSTVSDNLLIHHDAPFCKLALMHMQSKEAPSVTPQLNKYNKTTGGGSGWGRGGGFVGTRH